MKHRWPFLVLSILITNLSLLAQSSAVLKLVREVVEGVAEKGGKTAASQLIDLGGERLVKEALEKAAEEGGEKAARRLASQAIEHGPAVLQVARESPARFVAAFDELSPPIQKAAAQAFVREPDEAARLFSSIGKEALEVAGRHPGVGTRLMSVLGKDGAETLLKLDTDNAINLSRLAPHLVKIASPERRKLLEVIEKSPERILKLLNKNPTLLVTGAGIAFIFKNEEQILGGAEVIFDKDGNPVIVSKPGIIERTWVTLIKSIPSVFWWIGGLGCIGWVGIKLWGTTQVERARVKAAQSKIRSELKREEANR